MCLNIRVLVNLKLCYDNHTLNFYNNDQCKQATYWNVRVLVNLILCYGNHTLHFFNNNQCEWATFWISVCLYDQWFFFWNCTSLSYITLWIFVHLYNFEIRLMDLPQVGALTKMGDAVGFVSALALVSDGLIQKIKVMMVIHEN